MSAVPRRGLVIAGLSLVVATAGVAEPFPGVSRISASGGGKVHVPAHSVELDAAVAVVAETATEAAAQAAERMARVLEALVQFGVDPSRMSSQGYTVTAEEDWETGEAKGYSAHNTVRVSLDDPEKVGQLVDTALRAGATEVTDIDFLPEDPRAARDRAIDLAFEQAERDATVLASAAGGHLGRLLELSTSPGGQSPSDVVVVTGAPAGPYEATTPVPVPEVSISARVSAEWEYVDE